MQAFYNLSEDECRAAVFTCPSPLCVATDEMVIYAGVDENSQEVILVQSGDANVLLTNGDKPYPETKSAPAPEHPWVFSIESDSHLAEEAKNWTFASLGGISLASGEDHAGEWFLTVSIMEKTFFLFRLPTEDVEPWSKRAADPILPGPQEPKLPVVFEVAGPSGDHRTGDPDLDWLLADIDSRNRKAAPPDDLAKV